MPSLLQSILITLIGIALTIFAGILIEQLVYWFSWRFKIATSSIAMIFTPLITSSPELATYIVALCKGEVDVAIGSIIAQPFMASTIIYPIAVTTAIIGWLVKKRKTMFIRVHRSLAIPLLVFSLPLIPLIILKKYIHGYYSIIFGVMLLGIYLIYVKLIIKPGEEIEVVTRLYLRNVIIQILVSILLLYFGSHMLVDGVVNLAKLFKIDETAMAIIIIPIATAMPESIVGLIFITKGRDNEGIGSIVGEKALYSTFYPGIALIMALPLTYNESAIKALEIAIIVSILESIVVWFGYFGFTAPIGLSGFLWYVYTVI